MSRLAYSTSLSLVALGVLAGAGTSAFARSEPSLGHVRIHNRVVKEHLRRATEVEFEPFTVIVPAHWSFQAIVEPKPVGRDGRTIDFIASPGNLKKSRIYVGVRERASKMTMKQRSEGIASEKGHRFKTVHWNGIAWILDQFQGPHSHTTVWNAYVVRSGKEYLIAAESPNKERPNLEPTLFFVMKSVKFSSRPASTRPQ